MSYFSFQSCAVSVTAIGRTGNNRKNDNEVTEGMTGSDGRNYQAVTIGMTKE